VSAANITWVKISGVADSYISDTSEPFTVLPVMTGVQTLDHLNTDWNIYPNPTGGQFFIQVINTGGHDVSYSVFSLEGKELFSATEKNAPTGDRNYPVNVMNSGVYIIQLEYDGQVSRKKLVVW